MEYELVLVVLDSLREHFNSLSQICDLGSARSLQQTTQNVTAVGTSAWIAPEVGGSKHCCKSHLVHVSVTFRAFCAFFLRSCEGMKSPNPVMSTRMVYCSLR